MIAKPVDVLEDRPDATAIADSTRRIRQSWSPVERRIRLERARRKQLAFLVLLATKEWLRLAEQQQEKGR